MLATVGRDRAHRPCASPLARMRAEQPTVSVPGRGYIQRPGRGYIQRFRRFTKHAAGHATCRAASRAAGHAASRARFSSDAVAESRPRRKLSGATAILPYSLRHLRSGAKRPCAAAAAAATTTGRILQLGSASKLRRLCAYMSVLRSSAAPAPAAAAICASAIPSAVSAVRLGAADLCSDGGVQSRWQHVLVPDGGDCRQPARRPGAVYHRCVDQASRHFVHVP